MCRKFFSSFLVLAGIVLLLLNIYSFFYVIPRNANANKTPSAQDVIAALDKLNVPTTGDYEQYYKEVTDLFYKGIKHAWYEDDKTLGPNFFYNWSLFLFSDLIQYIPGESHNLNVFKYIFEYFEYPNYKDAVERGVGLCSQHAIAVADYLNQRGVDTKVVGLNGHVINEVVSPDEEISIIDADYNVSMGFPVQYAKDNPAVVEEYYINAGASQKEASRVAQIYKNSIYRIYPYKLRSLVVTSCFFINWLVVFTFIYLGLKMHRNDSFKINAEKD